MSGQEPRAAGRFKGSDAMNVVYNITTPFTTAPTASLLQIAADTVVESMVRRILKKPATMREIGITHALSMPFRGAPFVFKSEDGGDAFPRPSELMEGVSQGLIMTPSILLAQYIKETGKIGFHLPKPDLWDIVAIAVAQGISAPLLDYAAQWFPESVGARVELLRKIYSAQQKNSVSAL